MTLRQSVSLLAALAIVATPVAAQGTAAKGAAKTTIAAPAPTEKAAPTTAAPTAKAAATAAATIDINTATKGQLMAVKGIGDAYAAKIIAGRPYTSKDQLWRKKVLPQGVYDRIKDMLIAKQQ